MLMNLYTQTDVTAVRGCAALSCKLYLKQFNNILSLCCRGHCGAGCGGGQQEVHGAQWGTVWCSDGVSLADSRVLCRTGLYDIQPTRAHLLLNLNIFSSLESTSPGSFIFTCLLKLWQLWIIFLKMYKGNNTEMDLVQVYKPIENVLRVHTILSYNRKHWIYLWMYKHTEG